MATLADEPVPSAHRAALADACDELAVLPLRRFVRWPRALASLAVGRTVTEGAFASRTMQALVGHWTGKHAYDGVVCSASSMAPYLAHAGLRDVPAVVDLVDVDSEKWLAYAAAHRGPKAWLYRLEGIRLRRLESRLAGRVQALTLVSDAEVALFRNACGDGPVYSVGNGVDLGYFTPDDSTESPEPACVFVGALDYRPNIDGVVWFCHEVWPQIHQRDPRRTFAIVGRRPVAVVRELSAIPGVDVVGEVPDVRPWLRRATFAVSPLRIARGVQNKVLEAMAMGKAVLASPQSLQGIQATPGEHLLRATTVGEWVETAERLFLDGDARTQLGRAARGYVEARHHWDARLAGFAHLLGLPEPALRTTEAPPTP